MVRFSQSFFKKRIILEAKKVTQLLKKLILNVKSSLERKKTILKHPKIARNKIYKLLIKECNRLKIKTILLGHQINDFLKIFFKDDKRCGLKGLTSFGKNSEFSNIKLIRPLINVKERS